MSEAFETMPETTEAPADGARRKPGRPLGSKNKLSKEARSLLLEGGPKTLKGFLRLSTPTSAAITTLHNICEGKPLPGPEGAEPVYPGVNDILGAWRVINEAGNSVIARMLPELKASEFTGPNDTSLFQPEERSNRDVAKATLATIGNLLAKGVAEGGNTSFAVAGPDEALVRVRNPDLARRVLGADLGSFNGAFNSPSGVGRSATKPDASAGTPESSGAHSRPGVPRLRRQGSRTVFEH